MKENSHFDNVSVRLHLNKKNKVDLSVIEETGGKKSRKKKRSGKLDDLVTLGDAWLEKAVKEGSVQPIIGAEQTRWWDEMPAKCKKLVLRDREGQAKGKLGSKKATYVWGVPYKWGCLCMLARQDKLDKLEHFELRDWSDLWHSSLRGKIALPNSPRLQAEITLRSFGKSFNSTSFYKDKDQLAAFRERLERLRNQVKTYSLEDALKSMKSQNSESELSNQVYLVVGWSHALLPFSGKSQKLKAFVPTSGTVLTADCFCVPHYASISSVTSTIVDNWFAYTTGVDSELSARSSTGLKRGSADISLLAQLEKEAATTTGGIVEGEGDGKRGVYELNIHNNYTPVGAIIQKSEFLFPL